MVDAAARGSGGALAGLRVLVTRPRRQSAGLVALIEKCGGTAIRFPVIEILPAHETRAARLIIASLAAGVPPTSLTGISAPNADRLTP